MFVIEPSDAVNAGMAIQTEGRRLTLCSILRPKLNLWLVGWLVGYITLERGHQARQEFCVVKRVQVGN